MKRFFPKARDVSLQSTNSMGWRVIRYIPNDVNSNRFNRINFNFFWINLNKNLISKLKNEFLALYCKLCVSYGKNYEKFWHLHTILHRIVPETWLPGLRAHGHWRPSYSEASAPCLGITSHARPTATNRLMQKGCSLLMRSSYFLLHLLKSFATVGKCKRPSDAQSHTEIETLSISLLNDLPVK